MLTFSDIRPFVRFARTLELTPATGFPRMIPRDARVFYVSEGEGMIELDGQPIKLPRGSFLFINAGEPYWHLPCTAQYLALNFDFTDAHRALSLPIDPITPRTADAPLIERVIFADAPFFERFALIPDFFAAQNELERIIREYEKKPPYYVERCSALTAALLIKAARRVTRRTTDSRLDPERIMDYVLEHFNEPLTNESVAAHFGFHPNYVSAELRRYLGRSLHRYVLELRVQKAITLMETGDMSVAQIAAAVGFGDANYFSRYFKKITGQPPKRYHAQK